MLTGSCLCGDIAFEIDGPVDALGHRHCSRCRRAAGAAYQTLVRARRRTFRWRAGAENVTTYRLPGTRFACAFCRTCGGRTPWERDDQACIPAGCLDGDPGVRPTDNIFTDSRAAWTVVDERLESWPEASGPR